MKLLKGLLLGSTASLAIIAQVPGARAADLPVRQAAPIEYVRICDAYGAGFFFIPGTDTCLRVGGLVLGEFRGFNPSYSIGGTGF
jgi:Porin subfamily